MEGRSQFRKARRSDLSEANLGYTGDGQEGGTIVRHRLNDESATIQ